MSVFSRDLSNNRIGCLNVDIFKGLTSLMRLNLSGNLFSSLSQGTFDSLLSLKILDFQTPFLLCDCNMVWLLHLVKERGLLVKNTLCSYPRALQKQLVTTLDPEALTCDAPLELPSFQMTPSQRQVVFQGDSLPFQCTASFVDADMQVLWYQDGKMVEPDATQGIYIEKSMVQNCSLIASALTISNIQPGFTGNWECRVWTSRGNNTRAVHIVVLESSAKYCPPDKVSNNKGEFRWPRTLAGITANLPCNRLASGAGIYSSSSADERRASRHCDQGGVWTGGDYTRCQYQKDVTRVLYIINQMPLNLTNAVTTARQLLVYTVEAANFSDKMDVIFVAEMIEKFGKFLGDVMVDISSNLMLADERVLLLAQREAHACSRIVECLQRIAAYRLASGNQGYSTTSTWTDVVHTVTPLHPVIYATAVILLLCLLTVIGSYIYHHRTVRVSRKCWHMLVNLCLHIFLTCGVFVGGINQTRYASVCQAVGIVLHYSTLATALWSGVTARNIYKQVTRKAKSYEELDEPPPPPRPMLRFYLIGGGIPVIVCGITAAANIKNYGSRPNAPYCWMAWEPSLGAFYGPAAFIVFVDCMYFLSILLQLRRHPERRYELKEPAEEQQRLATSVAETTDMASAAAHLDSSSVAASQTLSLSALENEHTFPKQLLGVASTLALYAALWVFGGMAVSLESPTDLVFACLFGISALVLSAFLIMHHCVNRQDMRRYWTCSCCLRRREYDAQVNDLYPVSGLAAGSGTITRGNGEVSKCAQSSAESSCTNKSAPSVRNSTQGCKLTNLQVEAAQCKAMPTPANGTVLLDNSLTEHSLDNEIKMHVAPLEVQFRPINNNNHHHHMTGSTNGHPVRHHKNRARAHRASRLTVLREYAYDVPTSVEGSVQSAPQRRHHHHDSHHTRNSRRAAYMAYRERQQSQLQQDSSDASTTLPRRPRYADRVKASSNSLANSKSNSQSNGLVNGLGSGGSGDDGGEGEGQSKNCTNQPLPVELETQPKSYGLNLASQNGPAKDSRQPVLSVRNSESAASIKTGLWKHETTV
uniref:Adhesion G protein-coupled receptor A3 n=1 Tax=Denticeps clupeoides TaxID=299321 RepID=A0AAY4D8L7_9TELE